jgi:hypothetical protein
LGIHSGGERHQSLCLVKVHADNELAAGAKTINLNRERRLCMSNNLFLVSSVYVTGAKYGFWRRVG